MSSPLERKFGRRETPCDLLQGWLEGTRSPENVRETYENLLATAPPESRGHAEACADCREAAADLVALRNLVRELDAAPVAGPWFVPRVMATIASQEAERSRAAAIWLAVPRFASRLSWVAATALVFTFAWLYERPVSSPPQTASAYASEHLFDPPALPAHPDDVLVSLNEKDQ
jgi:hypothetical protein